MPGTRKLNRPTDQRKAMLRNLVLDPLTYGKARNYLDKSKRNSELS